MKRSARLAGIGLMLLSIFMFSFGDALGKYMVATYSVGQLMWLRACAALLVLFPLIWRQRAEFRRIERPWLQLLRVLLSTLEVAAFFLATVYLPLADVITYYLASPIFVTALSGIVLGERVGWRRWTAITLAESANNLAIPGRHANKAGVKPGDGELAPEKIDALMVSQRDAWVGHAHALYEAAMQVVKAVDAKSAEQVSDAGGVLDSVCEGCHLQFWYPEQSR